MKGTLVSTRSDQVHYRIWWSARAGLGGRVGPEYAVVASLGSDRHDHRLRNHHDSILSRPEFYTLTSTSLYITNPPLGGFLGLKASPQ
jgi:hypothetical protein